MADIAQQCFVCHKKPEDLEEYVEAAADAEIPVAQYVAEEEGTYNPETGNFACTPCYVRIGTPSSPGGWTAP